MPFASVTKLIKKSWKKSLLSLTNIEFSAAAEHESLFYDWSAPIMLLLGIAILHAIARLRFKAAKAMMSCKDPCDLCQVPLDCPQGLAGMILQACSPFRGK